MSTRDEVENALHGQRSRDAIRILARKVEALERCEPSKKPREWWIVFDEDGRSFVWHNRVAACWFQESANQQDPASTWKEPIHVREVKDARETPS